MKTIALILNEEHEHLMKPRSQTLVWDDGRSRVIDYGCPTGAAIRQGGKPPLPALPLWWNGEAVPEVIGVAARALAKAWTDGEHTANMSGNQAIAVIQWTHGRSPLSWCLVLDTDGGESRSTTPAGCKLTIKALKADIYACTARALAAACVEAGIGSEVIEEP